MSELIELRGYAIPFLRAGRVGSVLEYADHLSFSGIITRRARPALVFGDHAAPLIGQIEELFADDFGLGFRALVTLRTWAAIRWAMTKRNQHDAISYCSPQFSNLRTEPVMFEDIAYERILSATVDHICISGRHVVYQDTGAWPADVAGPIPPRLARLADLWEQGFAAHRQAERSSSARPLMATKARPAADRSKPKLPDDRMVAFEAFRQRVAASLAMGHHRPAVLSHIAFTAKGGFDARKFDRQMAACRAARPAVW